VPEHAKEFEVFIPLGSKAAKAADAQALQTVFKVFSGGVKTNRDEIAYDFSSAALADRVKQFIEDYNGEVDRYKRSGGKQPVDDFVRYDKVKWSRDLKADLRRGNYATFEDTKIRKALYRPFCRRSLFFDRILNEEVYVNHRILPSQAEENENRIIVAGGYGRTPFAVLGSETFVDLNFYADPCQCFPYYVYDEDGTNRKENITDWALEHFREHCEDKKITKWNIFYYVYGVLHHPEYRTKYAENLKRELPRIPLTKDFWGFSKAGKELARLHIDYERLEPWPLKFIETSSLVLGADVAASLPRHGGVKPPLRNADLKVGAAIPLSYRVEDKMRLSKDHRSLKVNDSLTLGGIPPETFEYRLGNRSALEWVIDQYQVTEDKHSGIRSDPNRPDDPEYIVRLVGQVIRVSLETVKLVKSLPALQRGAASKRNPDLRL
jgi:predicted helicase